MKGKATGGSKAPYMTPELEHFRGLVKQLGLSHAQIAERLGLSESHVKNMALRQISRADDKAWTSHI